MKNKAQVAAAKVLPDKAMATRHFKARADGWLDINHRCPGEGIAVAVLATGLARLGYEVPEQDLDIPFRRIPTRPRSGFALRMSS